jgi:hypothetical protein
MTIAGMILVNNPGDWSAVYPPLLHAEWNGWTPTDLIFPFFLFIVGISMHLSFESRRSKGASRGELMKHAAWRALIIYAIGFFLAAFPNFDMHTVRFAGVLPRIAMVYLISSAIVLYTGKRAWAAITAGLLIGYWLLMTRAPGFDLTPDGNLAAWLDRKDHVRAPLGRAPLGPGGIAEHAAGDCDDAAGRIHRSLAEKRASGFGLREEQSDGAVHRRRDWNRDWGDLEPGVSDQQEPVDELVRGIHGRVRSGAAGGDLLGGGDPRVEEVGGAVPVVRIERDRGVRALEFRGEVLDRVSFHVEQ